jgi:streptogramin lyase
MLKIDKAQIAIVLLMLGVLGYTTCGPAAAAVRIEGQVQAGGGPLANSTVTLWGATAAEPRQLAQTRTSSDGRFELGSQETLGADVILYLVAKGGEAVVNPGSDDNPAAALLSVLGNAPPPKAIVNEMTTVASVWTHAQFLDGGAIKGDALGLRIAAGNVPNFVDLTTGGFGGAILDALNSNETPTMANFGTLADVIAGCVTRVKADACASLFVEATGPDGKKAADTLAAAQFIARNPAYKPERIFALLDSFYPERDGKLRATPFLPYLRLPPSAWVLPLKFSGGGLSGPAKIMFDSEGNAWTGDNFLPGFQAHDPNWNGNLSKIAPNGRPLSPPLGFAGGGILGPGFGTAIGADGRVWVTSWTGKTISVFDKDGKPLSPPTGYNFNGQLGLMQGIIVTPNGDVWALDWADDKVVYMPKGDASKAKFYCQSTDGKPNKDSPCKLNGPFHLAIDQQDRIWITNSIGDNITRFPVSDPSKVEVFPTGGASGKGMAIDSRGNAWITNTFGEGLDLEAKAKLLELKLTGNMKDVNRVMVDWLAVHHRGSVTMLRPDGTQAPGGSVFTADNGFWAPWGAAIDGDDHVWISELVGGNLIELCGSRTETCPPGMNTGDPISPKGGFVGGGIQWLTDVAVDPAGNVWVANNWQDYNVCFGVGTEATLTHCGGNGLTVFYGLAKPVSAPQIGPARAFLRQE